MTERYELSNWRRSEDSILGGVCAGLAKTFDMDPWVVRALWLGTVLFFGTGILAYLAIWLAFPLENQSVEQKRLLGVCGKISRSLDIDVGWVRLGMLALAFFSAGMTVVGYIILHFIPESYLETGDKDRDQAYTP